MTNAAEFASGSASRPQLEEIGPFVYEARQERIVEGWGGETGREEVTFRSRTVHHFLPSESVPPSSSVLVTVPNVLALTGMLKQEVVAQPDLVKQAVVWPLLDDPTFKGTGTELFMTMSVDELLWGHEEERACLEEELMAEADPFADWEQSHDYEQEENEKRSYLRPDGRCMFGLLAHKNDTLSKRMTIKTGAGDLVTEKGKMLSFGGRDHLGVWREGSKCDAITMGNDITALPPFRRDEDGYYVREKFDAFVDMLCRKVALESSAETFLVDNVEAVKLSAGMDTFSFAKDGCYLQDSSNLPLGSMDLGRCCEGGPIVASFPHFLYADQWYY